MIYLSIKTLHIVAVISWMAGLLYLPRLFVYHAEKTIHLETDIIFRTMEKRLYRYIMQPAMVVTWASGLFLAWLGFSFSGAWLHVKIALVVTMTVHHFFQGRWLQEFSDGKNIRNARFFRFQNEVPTILMIGIAILVIFKPF